MSASLIVCDWLVCCSRKKKRSKPNMQLLCKCKATNKKCNVRPPCCRVSVTQQQLSPNQSTTYFKEESAGCEEKEHTAPDAGERDDVCFAAR